MTKYQAEILFTCLNARYKTSDWTARNCLHLFVEEGNELDMNMFETYFVLRLTVFYVNDYRSYVHNLSNCEN